MALANDQALLERVATWAHADNEDVRLTAIAGRPDLVLARVHVYRVTRFARRCERTCEWYVFDAAARCVCGMDTRRETLDALAAGRDERRK